MNLLNSSGHSDDFEADFQQILAELSEHQHRELIYQTLNSLVRISRVNAERLDWKIIAGSLQDMQRAIEIFHPHRHTRKVSMFGSARTLPTEPDYQQAVDFAQCITAQGFMVLTGGGGGIMTAGNEGAGSDRSFGLNIALPFEQNTNNHIDQERLATFKYFFTRKLFFIRESDAIALFPGGFGTQDELFECLTLCQTGKTPPKAIVLVDRPGGDYWQEWHEYVQKHLFERGLVSEPDQNLYLITDNIESACASISNFYSVYHSSRWIGNLFVIRLNFHISDSHLQRLNQEFSDVLVKGQISRSPALAAEKNEPSISDLPRLIMYLDQYQYGRLYQLIRAINDISGDEKLPALHPEQK